MSLYFFLLGSSSTSSEEISSLLETKSFIINLPVGNIEIHHFVFKFFFELTIISFNEFVKDEFNNFCEDYQK